MILDLTPAEVKVLRKAVQTKKQQIAVSAQLYDLNLFTGKQYQHYSEDHKLLISILDKLDGKKGQMVAL